MSGRRPVPDRAGAPRRAKRALSHVGGPVQTRGDAAIAAALSTAFGGDLSPEDARQHVHGFHSYPARLHPTVARRAIELFAPASGTVLDPFCGSGTVVVESRLAGRTAWGTDLNPLAVQLSLLKSRGASKEQLEQLLRGAQAVARHAEDRRIARAGATRRYPEADTAQFDPHVLLELDGLRDGIEHGPPGFARDALWLVLSSILTKLSRRTGDTGEVDERPKRLAAGYPSRLFVRKAQELSDLIAQFVHRLPSPPPPSRVESADARLLTGFADATVDLVVTSPPYPGNYDYVEHHLTRLRWLGLDAAALVSNEIGARRRVDPRRPEDAVAQFSRDLTDVFRALHRLLRPNGRVLVVIADSVVARRAVRAEPIVVVAAKQARLSWLATASQLRPHFHRESARVFAGAPRAEHAILLERHADPHR